MNEGCMIVWMYLLYYIKKNKCEILINLGLSLICYLFIITLRFVTEKTNIILKWVWFKIEQQVIWCLECESNLYKKWNSSKFSVQLNFLILHLSVYFEGAYILVFIRNGTNRCISALLASVWRRVPSLLHFWWKLKYKPLPCNDVRHYCTSKVC